MSMMLRGVTPAASYGDLLQVPGGISATPTAIEDGLGNALSIKLSTAGLNLPCKTVAGDWPPIAVQLSNPPSAAELTLLAGDAPATVGAGFAMVITDDTDILMPPGEFKKY